MIFEIIWDVLLNILVEYLVVFFNLPGNFILRYIFRKDPEKISGFDAGIISLLFWMQIADFIIRIWYNPVGLWGILNSIKKYLS